MKKHLRCALAHFLYWIGHAVSIPMCKWEWAARLYGLYNRLMLASHDLDTGACRLWYPPAQTTDKP